MRWYRTKKQEPRTKNQEPIPIPPLELRRLVGPTEQRLYDNPTGALVFPEIPQEAYAFVFDFGCGCGRVARQLLQQQEPPERYVGVDLHRGMIRWCKRNLQPLSRSFEFHHQNIRSLSLNPKGTEDTLPFPVEDRQVTLFLAWSVFTHLLESAAEFYLRELARVLAPQGIALTTWFLFDKADFPMMQEFQNALFINPTDPSNAVIFDKTWVQHSVACAGLVITRVQPPEIRGFQWWIVLEHASPDRTPARFPDDAAPRGLERPPLTPDQAHTLGLDTEPAEQTRPPPDTPEGT
jgi:SAM-dependent methyltransferase